jgi:hypothetical protein
LNVTVVQPSSLQLQAVSGMLQMLSSGAAFQPVAVRVVDSATPPHPVLGASVAFIAYIGRTPGNQPILWAAGSNISQPTMPVILAESESFIQTGINGIASFPLGTFGISGNVAVVGSAGVDNNSVEFIAQQLGP